MARIVYGVAGEGSGLASKHLSYGTKNPIEVERANPMCCFVSKKDRM